MFGNCFLERGALQMKKLYGTVSINKILGKDNFKIEEQIKYYKLKNEKYGLEIVKSNGIDKETNEVTNMEDLTDNEDKIDELLNYLVIQEITPDLSDVIEDLLKKHALVN